MGVAIDYRELCASTGVVSYSGSNNLSNPDTWHYYSFDGVQGDNISISISDGDISSSLTIFAISSEKVSCSK